MSKPVAVLISDIHFTVPTLELATQSLYMAITHARQLDVPLIIAGDTLDSKAIIRGECANRLIEIFKNNYGMPIKLMVGNHDLLSEKSMAHSLEFLKPYVDVVDKPLWWNGLCLIPYLTNPYAVLELLSRPGFEGTRTLIMHQGVQTAQMGHYIQDNSSLPPETFRDFRVISGHYHKAQDIKCGPPRKGAIGLFSYIGNPYTLSFGEADDGPKGFRVLHDNGLLESVPTNLRKHVIIDTTVDILEEASEIGADPFPIPGKDDLVWLKLSGPRMALDTVSKEALRPLIGHQNFKLDKIPTDRDVLPEQMFDATPEETLDALIDSTTESPDDKKYLKALWREIL